MKLLNVSEDLCGGLFCCGRCVIGLWCVLITCPCIVFRQADCVSSFHLYYQIHSFSQTLGVSIHTLTHAPRSSLALPPSLALHPSFLPGDQLCSSVLGNYFQWRVSTQIHDFLVLIVSCGPAASWPKWSKLGHYSKGYKSEFPFSIHLKSRSRHSLPLQAQTYTHGTHTCDIVLHDTIMFHYVVIPECHSIFLKG